MPKVYCAALDCAFVSEDGKCHAKSISLSDHSVVTMWEGRQRFNRCKTWQESEHAKELRKQIEPLLRKMQMGNETR